VIGICLAGVTGWTGSAVAAGVEAADDLELRAGVARSAAGQALPGGGVIHGDVGSALAAAEVDVLIDYTNPTAVEEHARLALEGGVNVVIGTSGLDDEAYRRLDELARERERGIVAAGNFSVLAALLTHAALLAAEHAAAWELVEYFHEGKPDAPGGFTRELASRMSEVKSPAVAVPLDEVIGVEGARGATVGSTQVHSVRLPSFVAGVEAILAGPGERLALRWEGGESAEPYVTGTLLAARRAIGRVGLTRGLDTLLFERR
jgi:4-hydroxy-tetrahydrodipicolinate reductase